MFTVYVKISQSRACWRTPVIATSGNKRVLCSGQPGLPSQTSQRNRGGEREKGRVKIL